MEGGRNLMYNQNGIYYNEKHTISFGNVVNNAFSQIANTWSTWHLIPSSRPFVEEPTIVTKFVDIPGRSGPVDFTDFLTGSPQYGQRVGKWSFYIANTGTDPDALKTTIANALHGKRLKVKLQDDPTYYYEGRFTVSNIEQSNSRSMITISYQLDPYKKKINPAGTGASL